MTSATHIDAMVRVRDLARSFGQIEAVKGVSFEIHEGEIFGFLGPNGAGKSTTINMLCTLLKPSAGSATLNGFDVQEDRSDVRRSIGLVFQQPTPSTSRLSRTSSSTPTPMPSPRRSVTSACGTCSRWSSCGTAARARYARTRVV